MPLCNHSDENEYKLNFTNALSLVPENNFSEISDENSIHLTKNIPTLFLKLNTTNRVIKAAFLEFNGLWVSQSLSKKRRTYLYFILSYF